MNAIRDQKSPFFRYTPDDLRRTLADGLSPQSCADMFAAVSNHYWGMVGDCEDLRADTQAGAWTIRVLDEWESLYRELTVQIRIICGGCTTDTAAFREQLTAFMLRYGYRNGSGWWVAAGITE